MVPMTQIAAVVCNPGPNATFYTSMTHPVPQPTEGQVLVQLEVAGLCHSDLNRVYGPLPLINSIVGHEGVGRVVHVGHNAPAGLLHQRVGLGWLSEACLACEVCEIDYTSCPQQENLGRDLAGTFQQYIAVNAKFAHPIPDDLPAHEAAPLLCAGITMYSATKKAMLRKGQWLLIPGAGGGLGHLGVQIAAAQGLKVIALDTTEVIADTNRSGNDKREVCMRLGAAAFLDYKTSDVEAEVRRLTDGYGANAVICTSGATSAYDLAARSLRNAGSLVCVGVNPEALPVSALDMVRRGLRLVGSAVGTRAEIQEMMDLAVQGKLSAITEIVPFEELDGAAKRLQRGQVIGRLVVRLPA